MLEIRPEHRKTITSSAGDRAMLTIKDVLTPAEVKSALAVLKSAAFIDGKLSAQGDAQKVKSNVEAEPSAEPIAALDAQVRAALARRPEIQSYARPVKWSPVIFSRYEGGAEYGFHTDAPFMDLRSGGEMRVDLSYTLFLADPASYGGGELVLNSLSGEQRFKLPAGSLVLYPTTLVHRVTPVTRGARYAAVGWIQSRLANGEQRTMLCELEQAIASYPDDARRGPLLNVYANLMKMWAD